VLPILKLLCDYSAKNKIQREDGTFAIIVAPTRELCIQIEKVIKTVAHKLPWITTGK
jgi:ATP-dependent RNA helicase DDX31/DBP7